MGALVGKAVGAAVGTEDGTGVGTAVALAAAIGRVGDGDEGDEDDTVPAAAAAHKHSSTVARIVMGTCEERMTRECEEESRYCARERLDMLPLQEEIKK